MIIITNLHYYLKIFLHFYLNINSCEIDYLDDNNSLNNLVKTITYFKNEAILEQYEINYDDFAKIIRLKNNQNENNYLYDKLGRLIKENNQKLKIEKNYTYDNNGNLLTVVEKLENKEIVNRYEYLDSDKDLLIKYNNLVINYKNNNIVSIGDIKYEYIKNKYLSKVSLSDTEIVTYNYDSFGNRTYKIYNKNNSEVVHKYLLDEDKILRETINEKTIDYIYLDTNLIGFIYNENIYYYLKNVFGDITTILDNNGNVVGKYNYDSYGTCYIEIDQNGIATVNPFRYRSYYYDNETNLYYCKNRYYSPMLCRWISADSIEYLDPESINGLNLYAYCGNDPIMYSDPSGHIAISTLIVGAIIGFVVGGATSAITQGLDKGWDNINGWQVLLDATIGGISGALGASGINQVVSMIAGGVLGSAGSIGGDLIASGGDWSQVNVGKAILMGAIGVGLGRWTGAGTQNSKAMVSTINAGKSWGSKAFLTSAKEALLRPNSGLTLQTMYMNMAKAISLYIVQGITKVSVATLGSTILGNMIGW